MTPQSRAINMLFSPPVTLIGCSNIHVSCASLVHLRSIYLIIIFFKFLSSYCFLPRRSLQTIVLLLLSVGFVLRSIFLTSVYVLCTRCTGVKIFVLRTWTYLISNTLLGQVRSDTHDDMSQKCKKTS